MKNILFVILALMCSPAYAAPASSSAPITITAAKSLEWDRRAKTYTARENVVATQGAANIHSDLLVAHYDDSTGGKTNIKTLEAIGHVTINSAPYTAYGDRAVYDVKTGNAVLTGQDLRIISTDSTLTAREKIVYNSSENKMTAIGAPKAVRGDDTLTADTMSTIFTKDSTGKMTANKITAHGHVVIRTPTETATGDDGIYDIPTQKAALTGNVTLLQDKNTLNGTRADVDMVTGISRLSGGNNKSTEGRVTGTFYPEQKKQPPEQEQGQGSNPGNSQGSQ